MLSRQQAVRRGYTPDAIRHRVRTGRWHRVLPHTYVTSDTVTWLDRLYAATAYVGPGALLSGAAALCDRGLPSVGRPPKVLVLAPPGAGPHSTAWVRVRRSPRPMCREPSSGPPRVATARAVADLAVGRRHLDDVRALVTHVVRRGLCTAEDLAVELREGPQRGSAFLRQAIDEVDSGAWSAPEARAASVLRRAGVPRFEQNARIDLPGGGWFVADFLWRELRAILEIDSDAHHGLPGDADRTHARHLLLETLGYSVVHRRPWAVRYDPDRFADEIAAWLRARARAIARQGGAVALSWR